jgi:PPK2 family polyphosphate:nucleotide phosphotransferase
MPKHKLKKIDPASTGKFKREDQASGETEAMLKELYDQLYMMYADGRHSLVIILHGIDASGKDGTVAHIFKGANPQGIKVFSFKRPTEVELRHDMFWRCHMHMPEAGSAAIFNRSYYEEVTTVRVHPEMLNSQFLPRKTAKSKNLFRDRMDQINEFEKIMQKNGTVVLKFFLHISKEEQKVRLAERIRDRRKNWKFSEGDIEERKYWKDYMHAFQDMIDHTSTKHSPWHVIPADHKWYRNYLVTKILLDRIRELKMEFPKIEPEKAMKALNS